MRSEQVAFARNGSKGTVGERMQCDHVSAPVKQK